MAKKGKNKMIGMNECYLMCIIVERYSRGQRFFSIIPKKFAKL